MDQEAHYADILDVTSALRRFADSLVRRYFSYVASIVNLDHTYHHIHTCQHSRRRYCHCDRTVFPNW